MNKVEPTKGWGDIGEASWGRQWCSGPPCGEREGPQGGDTGVSLSTREGSPGLPAVLGPEDPTGNVDCSRIRVQVVCPQRSFFHFRAHQSKEAAEAQQVACPSSCHPWARATSRAPG